MAPYRNHQVIADRDNRVKLGELCVRMRNDDWHQRQNSNESMKGSAMTPREYDVVRLVNPLPEHGLSTGSRGTVVTDYSKYPGRNSSGAFEVEFMDDNGETLALVTVSGNDLEVVCRSKS